MTHSPPDDAVVRVWRGTTAPGDDADAYLAHLTGTVMPDLAAIPGYLGAEVLRRTTGSAEEFVVATRWASMDAVLAFAGPDVERAVVEPPARAVLQAFDDRVRHYRVAHSDAPAT